MKLLKTLYAKIALTFLMFITVLGIASLWVSQSVSEMYSQEVMQRLNQSATMYINDQALLIDQGRVNEADFDEVTNRAMILNPSLELYLVDPQGNILSHRLPQDSIKTRTISLAPIKQYLSHTGAWPILGDDPRNPTHNNVFSAFPITQAGKLQGYIYAIIGGKTYQDIRHSVMDSYAVRVGFLFILGSIISAALVGCLIFFFLTRRLTQLRHDIKQFNPTAPHSTPTINRSSHHKNDEISELQTAFSHMSEHIAQQFQSLASLDKTRRELIANTSHDLRTPLASMQGYIETLLIKNDSLTAVERQRHLETAFKQCHRLGRLIAELFELSKLESNHIAPKLEPFSLLELIHDCVQEFGHKSATSNININIRAKEDECSVVADIALIHRVLQNLIDNALQHTPTGGNITIHVHKKNNNIVVEVSDTGKGIQTHEIPYIFDRHYQSHNNTTATNTLQHPERIGSGLGLAIVKRILDLHQTSIDVTSQINKGTSFIFELPQPAQQ